ncbi:hypothetical protein [Corynebacterium glyciniphilum]|uniref:hypothetical protein n=1 Tax=Corynebacterium glyciniphilum TaxID=1404244 RepID=UPI003FD0AAAE
MAFAFKKVDTPADDLTWLGSKHAVGDARTVTIDGSVSALNQYADGYIPSGLALTARADGRFVPATDAAQVDGFLLTQQRHSAGPIVAPLLDHGRVIAAKLPEQAVDGAAINSPHFIVVGGAPAGGGEEGNG